MRSPFGLAGALALIVGIAAALAVAVTVGAGAELMVHATLAAAFLLLARAAADFRTPRWVATIGAVAMAAFGGVFLLQAIADVTQVPWLTRLAFDILGQRVERLLGYAFLAWCAAVLVFDSRGAVRLLGWGVFAALLAAEGYALATALSGGEAPAALKLLAVPVFAWLAIESAARRPDAAPTPPSIPRRSG